jgi:hypothetical protein
MVKDYTLPAAKKALANVHPNNVFNLKDGAEIKNLKQLYITLHKMEQSTFDHHVNSERNDFGNWVKDVHKDYKLANSLFAAKNKNECVRAVGSRLYAIQKTIEQRKSARLKETETAAERLEKILTEAMRAKTKMSSPPEDKKEDKEEIKRSYPNINSAKTKDISTSSVIMGKSKDTVTETEEVKTVNSSRIRNVPFELKKEEKEKQTEEKQIVPTAQDLLAESVSVANDPCEELIKFAETDNSPSQVLKEVSSKVSSRVSARLEGTRLSLIAGKVKKQFSKENIAEQKVAEQKCEEGTTAPVEVSEVSGDDDKKGEMLSHLRKVYKE